MLLLVRAREGGPLENWAGGAWFGTGQAAAGAAWGRCNGGLGLPMGDWGWGCLGGCGDDLIRRPNTKP